MILELIGKLICMITNCLTASFILLKKSVILANASKFYQKGSLNEGRSDHFRILKISEKKLCTKSSITTLTIFEGDVTENSENIEEKIGDR